MEQNGYPDNVEERIPLWHRRSFNLTSQFEVTYYKIDAQGQTKSILLHEGENIFDDEVIIFSKMLRCYSVTSRKENYKYDRGVKRALKVQFIIKDPSDFLTLVPSGTGNDVPMYFYFTSEQNSYGVERELFLEGNNFKAKVFLTYLGHATIKPTMTQYLKEKSGCRDEYFWDLFQPLFSEKVKEKCSVPCYPQGLPKGELSICQTIDDWKCAEEVFGNLIYQNEHIESKSCKILGFDGMQASYTVSELNSGGLMVCS